MREWSWLYIPKEGCTLAKHLLPLHHEGQQDPIALGGIKPCSEGTSRGTATSPAQAQKLPPQQSPNPPLPCKAHGVCSNGRAHPNPCSKILQIRWEGKQRILLDFYNYFFKACSHGRDVWEAPKQGSGTGEDPSLPARGCVRGPPRDKASTRPSPSGGSPAKEETTPSCTAEKPTEGLESTSPLLHTHTCTHRHAPSKSESWRLHVPSFLCSLHLHHLSLAPC